ncbi:hypothetical protein [Paenibacillus sp. MSJ-34]|uniref:hypothetical protein n=1 Tax=Paenibacillus sp. MSJ-34 TaxID=2841529 RepID=UPI001C121F51|nr:hypothetical protein [Paenibacillus sp. MSJ-34]MBU5442143.1 hypothetical protein [Paenibacillus sp. MSJ-34]
MKTYRKIIAAIGLVAIATALFVGWRYLTLLLSASRSMVSGIDTLRINVENADIYIESTEGLGDKAEVETIAESGSSRLVFSDKLEQINANSSSTSGAIDYEFHNDIKLNLKSSGKLISRIDSNTASPNTIDMQSESGRMSVSRK